MNCIAEGYGRGMTKDEALDEAMNRALDILRQQGRQFEIMVHSETKRASVYGYVAKVRVEGT